MVKVELDQVVAHAAGHDVAAGVDVDDDGVAVVLNRDGAGDVVELDGLERLVQVSAANVDGRLLVAVGAGSVRGVELAPAQRTRLAFVVPGGGVCAAAMAAIPRTNAAKTEKRMNRSSNQDVEQDVQAPGRILSHGRA